MAKIFISYSRKDTDKVNSLIKFFESANHDVWVDTEDIRAGSQWQTSIVQAIAESDFFIIALSKNSIKSDNVRRELVVAVNHKKEIIPVCIQDVELPPEMQYQLAGIQRINFDNDSPKDRAALLSALDKEGSDVQRKLAIPKTQSIIKNNLAWKFFGLLVLVSAIVVITIWNREDSVKADEIPTSTLEIEPSQTPEIFPIDDIVVMQKVGPEIELDIKVRNLGEDVAILKKASIHIQNITQFRDKGCDFSLLPQGNSLTTSESISLDISDLGVGQSKDESLSLAISANAADRFVITIIPKSEFGYWLLYKLRLELIYNQDNLSVLSDPIIFISSKTNKSTQSAELLYGYQFSDEDILTSFNYLLEEPYSSFNDNPTEEEIISKVRDCYETNLRNATAIFSEGSFFISEEARLEFDEWKKAK